MFIEAGYDRGSNECTSKRDDIVKFLASFLGGKNLSAAGDGHGDTATG